MVTVVMRNEKEIELLASSYFSDASMDAVDLTLDPDLPGVRIEATVKTTGQTGVEMEALTACSITCLTIYDMVKAADRGMEISGIQLVEKKGGKSGHWKQGDN